MKEWIEFESLPGVEGKVRCPKCGRRIGHQRMARGAHAAWHKRQEEIENRKSKIENS